MAPQRRSRQINPYRQEFMAFSRREILKLTGAALTMATADRILGAAGAATGASSIDRQKLVSRHNPVVRKIDPYSALTIGNGEFAFTADITGLQTFLEPYDKEFPLCTTAHWAWHSVPIPAGLDPKRFRYEMFDTYGREVGYATSNRGQKPLFDWLRENPHRLHLGRIGLNLTRADGTPAKPEDIKNIEQTLHLWDGGMFSKFEFEGTLIRVSTYVHPHLDLLAVSVGSPLVKSGRVSVRIEFPYGTHNVNMADWNSADRHSTSSDIREDSAKFVRKLDADAYHVALAWYTQAKISQAGKHEFKLEGKEDLLEFQCAFSPQASKDSLPAFGQTLDAVTEHWRKFWTEGAAIDLGDCTDPRAPELERRVILSQYNTAIHCAGSLPSAETGLLFNSWHGKFHLEMHWWHSAHFTAWNRFGRFERNMSLYARILPIALETAKRQGYAGARWPKMIGPDGHDSPSPVGPLLIWQQPHPIYYAELCYRHDPSKETLERWREIVQQSAEFMASYAHFLDARGQYVLGPPMRTVSENQNERTTVNPPFELAYWRFGLRIAQTWRERLGLAREPKWDDVLSKLSPAPTQDGLYLFEDGCSDTYTKWNWEHPAILGALGVQPGDGIDRETMHRSLKKHMDVWDWDRTWGWDFPMAAMCAARVGEPELAIQALLIDTPKNRYHPNGHVYQRPGLTAYLPANGGLLAAIALMAAGWTDGPTDAPGFPKDGKWKVRSEGLTPWM
jgi:protein-glucosylgalactosylhydroxylysine glucosidase